MDTTYPSGLVWLRRDLRVQDNAALYHALKNCRQVHVAFVFDTAILDALPRADRRVEFIRESLVELDLRLRELGEPHGVEHCGLIVRHGVAEHEIPRLAQQLGVLAVFASHDDEPYAQLRTTRSSGTAGRWQLDAGVLFFAGHGFVGGPKKRHYLLPADVNLKDLDTTAVAGSEVREKLKGMSGKLLMLVDACHSGTVTRGDTVTHCPTRAVER